MDEAGDKDSWKLYKETIERHKQPGRNTADFGAYIPSPAEIEQRKKDLKQLEAWGFSDTFISNVMRHDCPVMCRVRQMYNRYGVSETEAKCAPFWEELYGDDEEE